MSTSKPSALTSQSRWSLPIVVPATRSSSPSVTTPTRIRFVKSREATRRSSRTSIPRSAATSGALTKLTAWSTRPWKAPFRAATVSRRVSRSARAPKYVSASSLRAARRELHREPAELGGERDVRPERLEVLRADHRDVDRVRHEPALERGHDLLGHDHAGAVLRLVGRGGEVRRRDDVLELEQRPRVRLGGEDVERRACDLARDERVVERLLVHELAARGVDDPHAVAHLRDRGRVDAPARLVVERQVERDEVGRREHLGRGLDAVDAELAEALARDERVVGGDAHAEPERAARDLLADAAEAEHAERLVGQLDAAEARALPAALLQRRVRLRDVAGEGDEQADGVLGGRDHGRLGRVRDDDPAPRRRLDVDVVDPHARRGRSP